MSNLGRPKSQWLQIFHEQTDGTPESVSNRILGDIWGYGTRTDRYRKQDVESLGNALEAYATFVCRNGNAEAA